MAAIQLKDGQEFDGKALAKAVYEHLPGVRGAAVRPGRRASSRTRRRSRARRSTCARRATAATPARATTTTSKIEDPIYVLAGRDEGYVSSTTSTPPRSWTARGPSTARFGRAIRAQRWRARRNRTPVAWRRAVDVSGPPGGRRSRHDHGDRQPDAGFVLRPRCHVHRRRRQGGRRTGSIDDGADVVDVGGVKAGPGRRGRRRRGDRPRRAVHRMAARRLPRPADQRRHLARDGGQAGLRGRRRPDQRHLGWRRPRAGRRSPRSSAPGWCARTPAARCRGRGRSGSTTASPSAASSTTSSPR